MKPPSIKYYLNWLQASNYKSFYLATLRVAISIWLLKEVIINWPYMDILYGQAVFVELKSNILNRLPGGISFARQYYFWLIIPYVVVIFLNIAGIGKWLTAIFLFMLHYVLQQMNPTVLNGGDIMARLILFYLVFANTYQYFVWVKEKKQPVEKEKLQNLVSNLAAYSIMFQLCLSYFLSGMEKLVDPFWLNGEGTYYALSVERFMGTPYNKYLVQFKWFNLFTNYFTIAFELLFPLLIWIKKIRKPLLITGIIFHAGIYIFMMIYGFQVVFILMYGMFLPNDQLLQFTQNVKAFFIRKKVITTTIPKT